jgi:hypothetical protein
MKHSVAAAARIFVAFLASASLAASAFAPAQRLHAQQPAQNPVIVLRGHGDAEHDIVLRRLFAPSVSDTRPAYLLITRDTVISHADTVHSDVVVVGATLRLDGTITGDLIGVGGNVFVRPSAWVLGETHNIAGGLYPSRLAHMNPVVENSPNAPYQVVATPGTITIIGVERPGGISLPGIKGLSVPTYDRVNGVSLRLGLDFDLPRAGLVEPALKAWGSYYSQRGDFGGGGEFEIRRRRTTFAAGAERTTLTNERWIRSDISNSLAMLLQGKDYRNYYAADRAYVRLSRTLEHAERITNASITAQVEEASPLRAAAPWSLLGPDSIRPNDYGFRDATLQGIRRKPEGRLTSAIATLDTRWDRPNFIAKLAGLAEIGSTALDGEASFARYALEGDVALHAIRDHSLRVQWHFQGPLPGTDSLPYQRWSFVGGSGTLPTFQVAQFNGDRVALVETRYTIPLPHALTLPLLGRPGIDLLHYTGMAWTRDQTAHFEQNLGVQLGYRIAYLRFVTDPNHFGDRVKTSVGLTLPRKNYPWETADDPNK